MPEAAGGRGLPRRVEEEVNSAVVVNLDRQEQRRLALRHLLQQIRALRIAGGQRRQLLGELQQQLQPFSGRDRAEVLGNILQAGERGPTRAGTGSRPRREAPRTPSPPPATAPRR